MFKQAFTMVELLLVMGIIAILMGLGSINYFASLNQTTTATTMSVLLADLRSAQSKAMSGNAVSGVAPSSWGIKFLGASYVIFPGPNYVSGAVGNYVVSLSPRVTLTTTLASSQILFAHGSGEILNYDSSADTISLSTGASSKTIELNMYGVPNSD